MSSFNFGATLFQVALFLYFPLHLSFINSIPIFSHLTFFFPGGNKQTKNSNTQTLQIFVCSEKSDAGKLLGMAEPRNPPQVNVTLAQ